MYIPGLEFIIVHWGGKMVAALYVNLRERSPSIVVKKSDDILAQTKLEKTRIENLNVLSPTELALVGWHIAS